MKKLFYLPIYLFLASVRLTWAEPLAEAPNWCEEVKRSSLLDKTGNPLKCQTVQANKKPYRCVIMNNFWCQKHTSKSNPWKGTPRPDGSEGFQDDGGHAIFKSVDWSVRAMSIDLRSKYKRGNVSANEIAEMHSPWCDTLGSVPVHEKGIGRTCDDGRAKPPSGFSGPLCKRPSSKNPKRSDCQDGCNCPPEIAEKLIRGLDIGISVNDDLKLFDSNGDPLPNLVVVLKNLAFQEQGIGVSSAAIERGIKLLPK